MLWENMGGGVLTRVQRGGQEEGIHQEFQPQTDHAMVTHPKAKAMSQPCILTTGCKQMLTTEKVGNDRQKNRTDPSLHLP